MKIRTGLVSNSSSSSFICAGFKVPSEKYSDEELYLALGGDTTDLSRYSELREEQIHSRLHYDGVGPKGLKVLEDTGKFLLIGEDQLIWSDDWAIDQEVVVSTQSEYVVKARDSLAPEEKIALYAGGRQD